MREVRMILADLGLEIRSAREAGVRMDVEETGTTFAENALLKAQAVWEQTGDIVLADDSGLAVDYLHGEPGVYSSRYMGEDTSYEIKNREIIRRLADAGEDQRTARFISAIAAVRETRLPYVFTRSAFTRSVISSQVMLPSPS